MRKGMSTSGWEESVGVWLAIATGVVTGLGTSFAIWREWQAYRQNQVTRLGSAATVAVRRTEAAVVRPLLSERMSTIVARFVQEHQGLGHTHFRTLLFCDLYDSLRLSETEKELAKKTAVNHLVDLLRAMPSPPIRIKTDGQLKKHWHAITEQVETAYSLRPRPAAELLGQMAQFSGMVSNGIT